MKIKNVWIIPIGLMLIITAFFAGCTSTPNYNQPGLSITQPQNNTILTTSSVTITVQVSNFNVVNKAGSPNVAGEGHIHYFKDAAPPTTPNQPAVTANGTWVMSFSNSYTWTNVAAGMHTFSAELVNNDHSPLNPPIVAQVMITVQNTSGGSPQVSITQPNQGGSLSAGNITVSIDVSNFNIVNKAGQANVAGEGHVHYFIDVTAPTTPGQIAVTANGTWVMSFNKSYTWMNVPAGHHTFSVELVNNDHTPLQPPVTASVSVTLTNITGGGQTVDVYLEAVNIHFNRSSITVPVGATVNIHFQNNDASVSHNFALYTNSYATTALFTGNIIMGVSSTVYTFTAPSTPGTYYFRCDVHPSQMNGEFIVS